MRWLAGITLVAACSAATKAPVSRVRFINAEPIWLVDDRLDTTVVPKRRPDVRALSYLDTQVTNRIDRVLADTPRRRALGTNSLDEVPTSTWFENRVGVRDISAAAVLNGPGDGRGPDLTRPMRAVGAKRRGFLPGFIGEDAAGVRWLVKFEVPKQAETAADVAAQRLFWLAGFHVPENQVGYLRRSDVTASTGKPGMTSADIDEMFARAVTVNATDDRYRVLYSRFLDGKLLGPTPQRGTRRDDPNDTIPHERRRELRGFYVFAAWLQHTDFKEMGTLDVYREDPLRPGHHAVWHYFVDFGWTFGLFAKQRRLDDGHVERVDADHLRSFFSLGAWRRPWEGVHDPEIPGVGAFDAKTFDPGGYTPFASYAPFHEMDELDARWAVHILLRITPAHIRAALEAGRFDDPRAVDYLVKVLVERQRKTARYWLRKVSPLDDFTVEVRDGRESLCFADLVHVHRVERDTARTRYAVRVYDGAAAALGGAVLAGASERTCVELPATRHDRDGYTIVRIDVDRPHADPPAIEVHLGRDAKGTRRIIGIERRP